MVMAGDWIPTAKSLPRKREVLSIASATFRSRYEVVGILLDFWIWVDDESEDGQLPGMSPDQLPGLFSGTDAALWSAVISAGWLIHRSTGLEVPNFQRWLGRSAKRRLKETERKCQERTDNPPPPIRPHRVRKMSASDADKMRTTEEKRTEENRGDKSPPKLLPKIDPPFFDRFWGAYPRKIAKERARRAWKSLRVDEPLLAVILAAIERQKRFWTDPKYIPHAATWLVGRRWEDEPEPTVRQKGEMQHEGLKILAAEWEAQSHGPPGIPGDNSVPRIGQREGNAG
jgi:hypothetical protein